MVDRGFQCDVTYLCVASSIPENARIKATATSARLPRSQAIPSREADLFGFRSAALVTGREAPPQSLTLFSSDGHHDPRSCLRFRINSYGVVARLRSKLRTRWRRFRENLFAETIRSSLGFRRFHCIGECRQGDRLAANSPRTDRPKTLSTV